MNCRICSEKFNDLDHKPSVLNCGHVYCLNCLEFEEKCPKCCKQITSKLSIFLDYEDDVIVSANNESDEETAALSPKHFELRQHLTDFKLTQENFYRLHRKKLNENKKKIESIKNEINKRTNELINVLLINQENLFKQVESINQQVLKKQLEILKAEKKIADKFDKHQIKLAASNNIELGQNELISFKNELNNLQSELDYEFSKLSKFTSIFEFECNLDLHFNVKDNLIGKIIMVN